ncbi:hotdog fold thioesterase [Chitinophaga qingshengii]|uniref:Hotdog fold thioesterase n=1 Tax=Chitinophaga qingshengii TaxID=1569794 RepID=A0ABR7TII1_9BACT|nr:hotdog fold thioesterase [Chitinophaga qingshengii]MBC9929204.1 hotdog fold thioesterase [Chitinophaga qingshengii]
MATTIWHTTVTPADLNARGKSTMNEQLGMEFTEVGDNYLRIRMPVDHRTVQTYGILHGGASVALAETAGSVASTLVIDPATEICVGMEINANHVRSAREGYVHGTATPIHLGRRSHIWEIRITDDEQRLICICRHTVAVLDRSGFLSGSARTQG